MANRVDIVLLANQGEANAEIARKVRCTVKTVRTWLARYVGGGVDALYDRPRSGRPPVYTPADEAMVVAIACELPHERGLPLSRFSTKELHLEVARETAAAPSPSTIRRWLRRRSIKPWTIQQWIRPRDPRFREKATRVLDLYHGKWDGRPLRKDDVVVCLDEKPCQAVARATPTTPGRPGRHAGLRVEFEYRREGVVNYMAALFVSSGKVMGWMPPANNKETFLQLVDRVMAAEPCKSARRVFLVMDNGGSHHPSTFPQRLHERHPKAVPVHLPTHASWLNQVEIYFSILQRKALTPNDFPDKQALRARVRGFERRHSKHARPFTWNYSTDDLNRLLSELGFPNA